MTNKKTLDQAEQSTTVTITKTITQTKTVTKSPTGVTTTTHTETVTVTPTATGTKTTTVVTTTTKTVTKTLTEEKNDATAATNQSMQTVNEKNPICETQMDENVILHFLDNTHKNVSTEPQIPNISKIPQLKKNEFVRRPQTKKFRFLRHRLTNKQQIIEPPACR